MTDFTSGQIDRPLHRHFAARLTPSPRARKIMDWGMFSLGLASLSVAIIGTLLVQPGAGTSVHETASATLQTQVQPEQL